MPVAAIEERFLPLREPTRSRGANVKEKASAHFSRNDTLWNLVVVGEVGGGVDSKPRDLGNDRGYRF